MLFIETRIFTQDSEGLGLSVDDLLAIQDLIQVRPGGYPVISGTGGVRKLRYAGKTSGQGKRGALRVCYVYFPRYAKVFLLCALAKLQKKDLMPDDKKMLKRLVQAIENELSEWHDEQEDS